MGEQDGSFYITNFLVTIAETIKNYGYPNVLLNDTGFFNYHFGSNLILALLSNIFGVSVFFVYNFLYPLICLR